MKKMIIGLGLGVLLVSPFLALAAQTPAPPTITPVAPQGSVSGGEVARSILDTVRNWVVGITAGIVALFLIIGGLMYVTSGGEPQKAAKAKQTLIYALIGLIIILLSYVIITIISNLIGGAITTTTT